MIPIARTRAQINALPSENLSSELAVAEIMLRTFQQGTKKFQSECDYLRKRIKREKRTKP